MPVASGMPMKDWHLDSYASVAASGLEGPPQYA